MTGPGKNFARNPGRKFLLSCLLICPALLPAQKHKWNFVLGSGIAGNEQPAGYFSSFYPTVISGRSPGPAFYSGLHHHYRVNDRTMISTGPASCFFRYSFTETMNNIPIDHPVYEKENPGERNSAEPCGNWYSVYMAKRTQRT